MPKSPSKDTIKKKTSPQKSPVKKISIKEKEHETVSKIVSELVHDLEKKDTSSSTSGSVATDTQEVEAIVANLAAEKASNENKETEQEEEKTQEVEDGGVKNEAEKQQEEVIEIVEEKHSFFEGGEVPVHRSTSVTHHSNKKLFLVGFGVFCVTVVLTSLFYLGLLNVQKLNLNIKKEPVKTAISPSPTIVIPTLNKSEWSLEVLNGSGVAGVAKKSADTLEKGGYAIDTVGNSPKNVGETQIFIADSKSTEDKALFLEDIKKLLGVDASISGTLSDSKSAARIIVGSK